jgi:eukaryotic-like serine/threonine-protein kinase
MPSTEHVQTIGGRYRLGELIGQGGMGEVFAAQDLRLEREVALKLLRADLAERDGMRERVLAEARLAARLTHPHVVAVLDTGEQEGRPFVVMERLSGRTLRDELAGGPMPAERARDVGLQVLRALAAAHELGIVHRDVKPGNVLDAGVGTWKVADFGIAKWVHADDTLTGTGELLGSPWYVAPERIDGHQAGPAADLYAVGVLLYEAICGRRPFEGDDPIALAAAIREGRYERPASIAPEADPVIASVIERAMRSDPAERFADAEEMADALLASEWESDRHETVTMDTASSPPDEDGDATQAMQPMDRTALLPTSAAEAAPESAVPAPPEPYQAPTPRLARPRRPSAGMIAAVVIAIGLVVVLALVTFTGRLGSGPGRRPNATLPAPLEDALERLEDSVQP